MAIPRNWNALQAPQAMHNFMTSDRGPARSWDAPGAPQQTFDWMQRNRLDGRGWRPDATPPLAATDFFAHAKALLPGWPDELVRLIADHWDQTGDLNVAIGMVRQNRTMYDRYFPANRREDGTFRMTEQEYWATKDGYRQNLAARGINPDIFAGKEHKWIEGDISIQEHESRIQAFDEYLRRWGPEGTDGYSTAMQWYAQQHGLQMTEEAILVSMLDPELGTEVVRGRIPLAQIGGAASAYGFKRNLADARRLQGYGLTGEAAMQFYGDAKGRLPIADALARRYYDPQGGVDISTLEGAFIGRDAQQQRRLSRHVEAEQSSFSRRDTVQEDQYGRLAGLRQQ